jgi:hypothetical protein
MLHLVVRKENARLSKVNQVTIWIWKLRKQQRRILNKQIKANVIYSTGNVVQDVSVR